MSEAKSDLTFFNFPITMIPEISKDHNEGLAMVMDYCIARMAKRFEDEDGSARRNAIKNASEHYHVTLGNPELTFERGCGLILEHDGKGMPLTGIERQIYWDYYKKDKTPRQVEQLVCFMAIKSILGAKDFIKTNKNMVAARMAGLLSYKYYPAVLTEKSLLSKRTERYYMNRLLEDMQYSWNVKIFGNGVRGFYMSLNLSTTQMAEISEARKRKARIEEIKRQKRDAYEAAKAKYSINDPVSSYGGKFRIA